MRSDEIVKENKHHNHRIGTFKGIKAVPGLVPIFKLFVKSFNNIVGDVIFKACDSNMFNIKDGSGWYFVS